MAALGMRWIVKITVRRRAVANGVWSAAQTGHLEYWKGFDRHKDEPNRRERWTNTLGVLEEVAPVRRGEAVLDIGGGLDSVLDFVPGVAAFALDPLADKLAELGASEHIRLTGGKFENLPFRERVFDRVFLMNVLDHVQDPVAGLGEIRRVLRRGGVFVLSVDTFAGCKYYEKRLHKWWARQRRARTKHPWVFSIEDVQGALRRAGFEPSAPSHVPGSKARRTLFIAR